MTERYRPNPNSGRNQPEDRIYGGNPILKDSYMQSLREAALSGINVVQYFIYDPIEGFEPSMLELINRLRYSGVRAEAVPIP